MSIPNIENIKVGETTLDKIYIGEDVVYSHDKPVWLVRTATKMFYSLDGVNYNQLASWSGSERFYGSGFANGKIIFARWDNTALWTQDPADIAKGIYRYIAMPTSGATQGFESLATDGDMVIAAISNTQDRIIYSLNGGNSFTYKAITDINNKIRYLGDDRFYFNMTTDNDSDRKGKYSYWKSTNPTTYYNVTTTSDKQILDVQRCNDPNKTYYITTNEGTYKTYYSYDGKTLAGLVNAISPSGYHYLPSSFVYVYNKYYCIYRGKLYYSTDGKTFIQLSFSNYSGNFTEVIKSNNKLMFVHSNGSYVYLGRINENHTIDYTTVRDTEGSYSSAYSGNGFASNRFPRL